MGVQYYNVQAHKYNNSECMWALNVWRLHILKQYSYFNNSMLQHIVGYLQKQDCTVLCYVGIVIGKSTHVTDGGNIPIATSKTSMIYM